jgi:adenine-specific DNA-methyltransferase
MADKERIEKLKLLLKDLFQFENNDLDFGIYRIINIKKKEISEFIDKELFEIIKEKIKTVEDNTDLEKNLESLKKEIETNFGCDILEAKKKYAETPKVKDYLDKEKELKVADEENDIEEEIYDDIINFFSRYYDKGDFVSKRRYSKDHKYAIPYNGEEVYLYWANNDQYYIKTGENFKNYVFKAGTITVNFEIISDEVDVEKGNIKDSEKKFFIFNDVEYDTKGKHLDIKFGYRGLTEDEETKITDVSEKKRIGKDEVNEWNLKLINEKIGIFGLSELYEKHTKMDGEKSEKSELEWHLNKYTTKNSSDYFIHKDLKKFLNQELDFYIKNELLHIDDVDSKEDLRINLNRIKVFKQISSKVIEFLAQVEEFQKKLWEKKKFVIGTDYCITLDYIDEKYYPKILKNKEQLEEWKNLFSFDVEEEVKKLKGKLTAVGKKSDEQQIQLLKDNPTLVIDTKFYDDDFKYKILSEIDDLDEKTNGILINSDNYHALNLLLNKYKEKVKCCYIDPPFNIGDSRDFLYKVDYKDSSWCSLLYDRISLVKPLIEDDGAMFVRCDYNGNYLVRKIMDYVFGKDNFRNEVFVNRIFKNKNMQDIKSLSMSFDSVFVYGKTSEFNYLDPFVQLKEERKEFWRHMGDSAGQGTSKNFFGVDLEPPKGNHWKFGQENIDQKIKVKELRLYCRDCNHIHSEGKIDSCPKCGSLNLNPKYLVKATDKKVLGTNWGDISGYSNTTGFSTENAEVLLKRIIENSSSEGDFVIDFFLGSGTTIAVAEKLNRKWIGVEMGKYFEEYPLSRIKKAIYGTKNGVEDERKTKSSIIKIQKLEQYEDALNNIDFKKPSTLAKKSKDYKIKYMLEFETKESKVFLNLDALDNPFDYKLNAEFDNEFKETNIDLIETFNYIAGIQVRSILRLQDQKITYVVVKGLRNDKETIIIWRNKTENFDPKKDKEFIKNEILKEEFDEILVNGNSLVEDAKSIDEIFKSITDGY